MQASLNYFGNGFMQVSLNYLRLLWVGQTIFKLTSLIDSSNNTVHPLLKTCIKIVLLVNCIRFKSCFLEKWFHSLTVYMLSMFSIFQLSFHNCLMVFLTLRCWQEHCLQRLQYRIDVSYDSSLPEHKVSSIWSINLYPTM